MKSNPVISMCALGLLSLPLCGEDKPVQKYLTFEDSLSPDGAYAVAWSCPKLSNSDWESIQGGEKAGELMLPALEEATENRLVDLKAGRTITMLSTSFWTTNGMSPNHEFLDVAWSPASDLVVVMHRLHRECGPIEAVQLEKGRKVASLFLEEVFEAQFREHLASKYAARYKRDKGDLAIEFQDLKSLGGRKFCVDAWAYVPKSGDDKSLKDHSKLTLTLPYAKGQLRIQMLGFETIDDDADESPAAAAKAVAAADKKLNAEYTSLKAALGETARAELKQEQTEWLQKRDAIESAWQKSRFVDTRAIELQARRVAMKGGQ